MPLCRPGGRFSGRLRQQAEARKRQGDSLLSRMQKVAWTKREKDVREANTNLGSDAAQVQESNSEQTKTRASGTREEVRGVVVHVAVAGLSPEEEPEAETLHQAGTARCWPSSLWYQRALGAGSLIKPEEARSAGRRSASVASGQVSRRGGLGIRHSAGGGGS